MNLLEKASQKREVPPHYGGTQCTECGHYTEGRRTGTGSKGIVTLYCVHCETWVALVDWKGNKVEYQRRTQNVWKNKTRIKKSD